MNSSFRLPGLDIWLEEKKRLRRTKRKRRKWSVCNIDIILLKDYIFPHLPGQLFEVFFFLQITLLNLNINILNKYLDNYK